MLTINKKYTIFKSASLPPPFHILILIYGSSYITSDNVMKKNYAFYPEIMKTISASLAKFMNYGEQKQINTFSLIFNALFELRKPLSYYINNDSDNNISNNKFLTGGAPLNTSQYDSKLITKNPQDQSASKIAYSITIDMELHPGTSLTPEEINESKCNSKYNAIKKAFSEFTGRPYQIPPVYRVTQTKKNVGGKRNRITRKIY